MTNSTTSEEEPEIKRSDNNIENNNQPIDTSIQLVQSQAPKQKLSPTFDYSTNESSPPPESSDDSESDCDTDTYTLPPKVQKTNTTLSPSRKPPNKHKDKTQQIIITSILAIQILKSDRIDVKEWFDEFNRQTTFCNWNKQMKGERENLFFKDTTERIWKGFQSKNRKSYKKVRKKKSNKPNKNNQPSNKSSNIPPNHVVDRRGHAQDNIQPTSTTSTSRYGRKRRQTDFFYY